jgi:beta-lactam-binding protein with PASTA domain
MRKLLSAAVGAALLFIGTPALASTTAPAPPPLLVKVPPVVGATTPDAVKILTGAGLGASRAAVEDCAHIGIVLAQDPAAGRIVSRGTVVVITVGVAPQKGCF